VRWYPLILLLIFPVIIYSQTIQSIQTKGSRAFKSNDIVSWAGISVGSKLTPLIEDSIKSSIARNFAARGYVNSKFEITSTISPDTLKKTEILIGVKDGDPAYVKKILFENAGAIDSADFIPAFGFLEGQIFNKFEIENNIADVLTYYEDNGYPFIKIIISAVTFYSDSSSGNYYADIRLKIDKGLKNNIDKIEIAGNTKTKEYVISRELRIKAGEIYSQKKIEELPDRLNRLRFFESISTPAFYLNSKNEGVLLINIKEKETNNFDGILGYIPATTANQPGYLTGLVNVNLRNLFGTGRAASIRWQQIDRFSQELELHYLEPWFLDYPFNINGSLFQRKQDSSYVERKIEGSVEYLANENLSASVTLASDVIIPTFSETFVPNVFNSSSITTGISLKYDSRDDPYAPTKGIIFNNSYTFSKKTIKGPELLITAGIQTSENLQRITFDLGLYYLIFKRQVIAFGIHGRELRGSFFEDADLFRLGGTTTLRGYLENQFLGSRVAWTNLEYRFLLTRRSYIFTFLDTGYFLRNAEPDRNILKLEQFKMGYGLGLSVETGLGVLGVSFALANGDSFSQGKIHFGIINEF
jgi:outer membrane protein insertion porin family